MRQGIRILGTILLAAAISSPAWAKKGGGGGGGGESQAGGLPALEDRVEADEALIATLQGQVATLISEVATLTTEVATLTTEVATLTTDVAALQTAVTDLQGQNNWAVVDATCTVSRSNTGAVTSALVSAGVCEVTFGKDVSGCAYEATIGDTAAVAVLPGFITVSGDTDTDSNHDVFVRTFNPAGTATSFPFHLTVTCL